MKSKRGLFVAREGILFLLAAAVGTGAAWHFAGPAYAIPPALLFVWLALIFRDPVRDAPAVPLGALCPVDGTVEEVELTDSGALGREAHRILIRVNSLGTYTARCPSEGKITDLRGAAPGANLESFSGLWVQTDEGDDVVLQFRGHRFGLAPLAFLRYGERVGQGQRCAYLRLTRLAEVQLPINSRILVSAGQRVAAGIDVLARLPHP